jgi:RND superfamily putative drug exporter
MANFLYRLGRAAFHRRGAVVSAWVLLLAIGIAAVAALGSAPTSSVTVPGTESQRALDALAQEFPQASGASGTVAIRAPKGESVLSPVNKAFVLDLVAEAGKLPAVVGATSPYDARAISSDGRYALLSVQFDKQGDELSAAERTAYEDLGAEAPRGWTVAPGGEALMAPPEVGSTEAIGVVVALLVLLITFGSMVAAGMTMLNALLGVGTGMLGILAMGHVVDLTSTTPVLALMLGLAVGIDYSLFITSRYRHNVAIGLGRQEAAGRAIGTAGSAVVFAGLTVVIALAGLSVVGIPFLTTMGLAAAGTVTVAVLVAITLLPALLSFAGDKVLSRRQRKADLDSRHDVDLEDAATNRGFAWGRLLLRRRVPAIVLGVAALAVLAVPVADMRLGMPDDGTAPVGTSKRAAYDLVAEGFGEGFNGRLVMVVHGDSAAAVDRAVARATDVAGGFAGVAAVTPAQTSADRQTALVGIVPTTSPSDEKTFDLVRELRSALAPAATASGTDIALTGATALGIDVSDKLSDALPVYLLVVVGLSFLLLMLVFRSLLVPLKATLGFLLTLAATFGATVAVFQWGWLSGLVGVDTGGPLVSFLPIMIIGILFGLAMDYEVFLVSRMREDFVHGESAREAIVSGVGHGARVVAAAALIMISVFAGFILIDDAVVKSMGFALAVGVLVDAFVVRLTLVPAVMSFVGDAAWWLPRWLDRVLPNVDIEGEGLRSADGSAEHAREPVGVPV